MSTFAECLDGRKIIGVNRNLPILVLTNEVDVLSLPDLRLASLSSVDLFSDGQKVLYGKDLGQEVEQRKYGKWCLCTLFEGIDFEER